jgi:type I restriction enzyme R subunit
MELTTKERNQVKKVARGLLESLKKEKLVLDRHKRQQSRAAVLVTIEQALDVGLPSAFMEEIYDRKTAAVFQHVYDSYYGAGQSVYSAVA